MSYGFYCTDKGTDLAANAAAKGTKVDICKVAVGDGGDPEAQTNWGIEALNNEVYRKDLDPTTDFYDIDPEFPNQLFMSFQIPAEVALTQVNEVGFFDSENNLIIYGITIPIDKEGRTGEFGSMELFTIEGLVRFENRELPFITLSKLDDNLKHLEEKFQEQLDAIARRVEEVVSVEAITKEEIDEITGEPLNLATIYGVGFSDDEMARLLDDDPGNDPPPEVETRGSLSKEEILNILQEA